ncbi:DUF6083 domain-containing protein [Streptomyces sp. NPDC050698]
MAGTSPSRLLRAGQSGRCRQCGNRVDFYQRADQRPIALHPAELAAVQVPEACCWHLSSGIAYPHGDGTTWCRIPHAVLCPRRTPPVPHGPHREAPPPARHQHPPPDRHRLLHPQTGSRARTQAPTPTTRPVARPGPSCSCCCAATSQSTQSKSSDAWPRPATATAAPIPSWPPPHPAAPGG